MALSLAEQVEQKKLGLELKSLTAQEKLLENLYPLQETHWGQVVPRSDFPQFDNADFNSSGALLQQPFTTVDDRTEGKFLPVYRDEFDLRLMRARHRQLFHFVSTASGLVESLIDYTVGDGFTIEVKVRDEDNVSNELQRLASFVQSTIEDFLESIKFPGDRDRDLVQVPVTDGELFWALYPDIDKEREGFPKLRQIEPDEVTEPNDPLSIERWLGTIDQFESFWKFGVHTKHCAQERTEDIGNPLGYHVIFDDGGTEWDYIPSERMIHIKRNVGKRAKRGVSDFLATDLVLDKSTKLTSRTADGAIAQASIAYIRKWEASQGDVESLVNSQFGFDVPVPNDQSTSTSRAVTFDRTKILDVPAGAVYESGPMGQLRQPVYAEIAQFLLRLAAARWSMPEFMISGDASNNNFASTLVTESPFVKARERDQRQAVNGLKELIWKALKLMFNDGHFSKHTTNWSVITRLLELIVVAPEVATRDREAVASWNSILNQHGIKSKRTWAEEEGLDFDAEQDNIESEPVILEPTQPFIPERGSEFSEGLHVPVATPMTVPSNVIEAVALLEKAYAAIQIAIGPHEQLLAQTHLDMIVGLVKPFITLERDHNSVATEGTPDAS